MRNVTTDTVTQAVKDTFTCQDERIGYLLSRLVDYIHDYARETGLTHAEWRKAIELLTRAGEITDSERNEFVLFSDILGPVEPALHERPRQKHQSSDRRSGAIPLPWRRPTTGPGCASRLWR